MEKDENKRIIDINGVKLEVDLRDAKVIDNYKVGQNVRVLTKEYGDKYKVNPGVIVGFDDFEQLPTITVAYIEISYSGADVKFLYINSEIKDAEIAPAYEIEDLRFKKSDVISKFETEISKRQEEIKDIERKKEYFLKCFDDYFRVEKETQAS